MAERAVPGLLPLYEALFTTAPDAMIVVDASGVMHLANPQAAQLFGYADSELPGQPVEILLPERVREAHRGHVHRYAGQPRMRPMGAGQELIGRRADGTLFPVEVALSPILTPEGSFFAASIRDISATQRVRQAMARARHDAALARIGQLALESPAERTLEAVPALIAESLNLDVVLVVLGHGARTEMRVRAAHGATSKQLEIALDAWAAVARSDPDNTPALPGNVLAAGGFRHGHAARLHDLGQPLGAVLAMAVDGPALDRDGQHFLQAVAHVLAAMLQRQRTQEQLAHAQRLEAVGQLTGGIAHDFNNLLTMISGNLQLLEAELEDRPDVHPPIASALRAVGRGAELTRKLLAFARRQRLSPRAVDPRQLLGDLCLMLKRTLGEQVDVELHIAAGIPAAFADPAQLDAALLNLALNARDAMPRGGRLKLAARRVAIGHNGSQGDTQGDAPAGDYVEFSVVDSGHGMSAEVRARAFEPFYTTKEAGKGSGLGLSMVYGFVKQSGGHLEVESAPGRGTRIALFLPVAAMPARMEPAGGATVRGGRESVLVVEDEPDVRQIAEAFLRGLGYAVQGAANASEALAVLARQPETALLFSDVVLGAGPSGGELAATARARHPRLAVLLTSGYERPAAESAQQPGHAFPLLRKPYRREELAAAVREVLDGTATSTPPVPSPRPP